MKYVKFTIFLFLLVLTCCTHEETEQKVKSPTTDDPFDWIKTARVFLLDAYYPPFAPELEYDAELLAETIVDMHGNVARLGTMGKYATIQGVRFTTHPDQGDRDLLAETILACKPRNIKVIPYISTGHKLDWSMIVDDYPEYAQKATPGGGPLKLQMMIGEDHATVCWMTPYRKAFMDLVEHVVRDYDIDGMYFDSWTPFYFWTGAKTCYCDGCKKGFKEASGKEIPYHSDIKDYTQEEWKTIDEYHHWYYEEYIKIVQETCRLIRSYKNVPLIYNVNNPVKIANEDPRILDEMDAFLYERSRTILERAEGVSLARGLDLDVWPYIGVYNNWQRTIYETNSYQQQIFTNIMFGGGAILAQPYAYTTHKENRKYVSFPFEIIEKHEDVLKNLKNYPFVGIVYSDASPPGHARSSWWDGMTDARTSTLGAFAACLFNHIQVSSIHEFILDRPEKMEQYSVLYLADIPYLSEERIQNLKEYVKKGGGLIISYATSLYSADGKRLQDFALKEIAGVKSLTPDQTLKEEMYKYSTKIGGPSDLYLLSTGHTDSTLDDYWNDRLVPAWYYEPVVALDKDQVIMNIVTGDGRRPMLPAVVLSQYGEGKVLYSAVSLESLFQNDGKYVLKDLIRNFIKLVSAKDLPYTLEAPSFLISNLAYNENQWIFHLMNWTGNKFEKPYFDDPYLAPVENVILEFDIPKDKKIKSVSTFVDLPIKTIKGDRNVKIQIPRIESYQGIQFDFE